ncbi:MAG: RNA polymerase sigma factor [Acidimicrobiia bacterium]
MIDQTSVDSFTAFVEKNERSLQQALCATFGRDRGLEATAEAFMYAWQNWDQVQTLDSPVGYLYGVGRNKARAWGRAHKRRFPAAPAGHEPRIEPGLPDALARLSDRQREAVMLVYCFDWTFSEAAQVLGVSKATLQQHADRGLKKLQRAIGAAHD